MPDRAVTARGLCGPCLPRAASAKQRGTCFAPACVAACRWPWELNYLEIGMEHSREEGQGSGTKPEHWPCQYKAHMQEACPFSWDTSISTSQLLFRTRCVVGRSQRTQLCFQQLLQSCAKHHSTLSISPHTSAMLFFTAHGAATPAPAQVASSPWIRSNKASHSAAWPVTAFLHLKLSCELAATDLCLVKEVSCCLWHSIEYWLLLSNSYLHFPLYLRDRGPLKQKLRLQKKKTIANSGRKHTL